MLKYVGGLRLWLGEGCAECYPLLWCAVTLLLCHLSVIQQAFRTRKTGRRRGVSWNDQLALGHSLVGTSSLFLHINWFDDAVKVNQLERLKTVVICNALISERSTCVTYSRGSASVRSRIRRARRTKWKHGSWPPSNRQSSIGHQQRTDCDNSRRRRTVDHTHRTTVQVREAHPEIILNHYPEIISVLIYSWWKSISHAITKKTCNRHRNSSKKDDKNV